MKRITILLFLMTLAAPAAADDYLRLSLNHERSSNTTFFDRQCEPSGEPVAYFGCIDGDDGRPIGARGDFGNSLGGELAWGRDFNHLWRGEIFVGYQPNFDFDGNANFIDSGLNQPVDGSLTHWRGGVQGYLDLAAVAGHDNWPVSPWIGAGIGVARNRVSTMAYQFPELSGQPALTTVPGGSTTGIMWTVSAGADFEITPRNVLEVGLTWADYGDVRTGTGDIEVIRSGELLAEVPVGQTRADLEAWGLRVGLRHYFGR